MSDVQNWDPNLYTLSQSHRDLLNSVEVDPSDNQLHLTKEQREACRGIFHVEANAWTKFATDKEDEELIHWVKVLTLCPEQYSGFESGANSPVISLVRVLRQRGSYPTHLTAWIKQHSTNRYLPHGNLADRLSKG